MAELFCGPGGLALGASLANEQINNISIEPCWANDIDTDTCNTYSNNILNGINSHVVCENIENIDFEEVPDFEGLCFGFPCNDFSIVGEKKGTDGKYGPLYKHGIRAIKAKNPSWFIAENVGGLQSSNEGKAFNKIINELKSAGRGYNLNVHLYKFEEYGVPQKRHRIIIVGVRSDLNLHYKVPTPTTPNPDDYMTAQQALTNPPITKNISHNEFTNQSESVVNRLMHIPPGENAWYEGIPKQHRLNVKGAKLSQIYKRLHPDRPSYTITGSGGGGTHGYHWEEHRALTNRERARIQTFPDNFIFSGGRGSIRKQIGMAVPPHGAKHIFLALMKTLTNTNYDFINPKFDDDYFNEII